VARNVACGLEKVEINRGGVSEALELVGLSHLADRYPDELSGGQAQRVALARALAPRPRVLLFDEPFSNLDTGLRTRVRADVADLMREVGMTSVFVTHDQEEAMTLSTRIAVMDHGWFQQIGTPTEIYEFPESRFVADFIGSANMFEGRVAGHDGDVASIDVEGLPEPLKAEHTASLREGMQVWLAVRPEKMRIATEPFDDSSLNSIRGSVADIGYYGDSSTYRLRVNPGLRLAITHPNLRRPRDGRHVADWDETVYIGWVPEAGVVLTR